jgi:hypothetical protein
MPDDDPVAVEALAPRSGCAPSPGGDQQFADLQNVMRTAEALVSPELLDLLAA